jgi:hypothetical protein
VSAFRGMADCVIRLFIAGNRAGAGYRVPIRWRRRLVDEFFHDAQQSATWRIVILRIEAVIREIGDLQRRVIPRNANPDSRPKSKGMGS